jgi:hypothetical protein
VNGVLDKCARDAGAIAEIVNREMEIETYSEMYGEIAQKPDLSAASHQPPASSNPVDEQLEAGGGGPEAEFLNEEDFK